MKGHGQLRRLHLHKHAHAVSPCAMQGLFEVSDQAEASCNMSSRSNLIDGVVHLRNCTFICTCKCTRSAFEKKLIGAVDVLC